MLGPRLHGIGFDGDLKNGGHPAAAESRPQKASKTCGSRGSRAVKPRRASNARAGLKVIGRGPMDETSGNTCADVSHHMTPPLALEKIRTAFVRMDTFYGRTVFDEWAVLSIEGPRIAVLAYEGPRRDTFAEQVRRDLVTLQNETQNERRDPGAFAFSREAEGPAVDAYIVLGTSLYLVCNNTQESIAQLALDPQWRKAQVPFADLAELFRHHPLISAPVS